MFPYTHMAVGWWRIKKATQVGSSNYPKALSIIKIITHAKILIAAARRVIHWLLQFA